MATLSDIAHRAEVSMSTVSRALSNYPYVSEATRTKVMQAAQELGYVQGVVRRSPHARSVLLTSMGTHSPGPQGSIGTEFSRRVLTGAQLFFKQHNIAARMLTDTDSEAPKRVRRIEKVDIRRYTSDPGLAGLILLGGSVDPEFVAALKDAALPFVIVGGSMLSAQALQVDAVTVDYSQGVKQAVDHLVATGRRRIALVNGPDYTTTSNEKDTGFRCALSLHDLPSAPRQQAASFTPEEGYAATLHLLGQRPGLDAIVYASDYLAMGGLHALKENGYRVPHDVAVTGFHDYEIAPYTDPPLTSVKVDMQRLGMVAAQRLYMMLREPNDRPWYVLEPTSLVARGSTAM